MSEQIVWKLAGLWFALSVGSLAATINPSASTIENTKLAPASSTLGAVYREARDYNTHDSGSGGGGGGNSYGNYRPYDRPQQRCISCLYAAMTGNQDRDRPGYQSHPPASGYGMASYGSQRENDDRSNWYYQSDDRNRYSQYDRYYQPQQHNRYDYRPGSAGLGGSGGSGGYDRNDYRQNYQDYRGNGYDNRDPMYFNAMRGGGNNRGYGNRESSYESYYDDRMTNRGYGGSSGYAPHNSYMRPGYQSSGYDQDRYYGQGRPYERPERPERPEYYDKNSGYSGYNSGYSGSGYGSHRGGSSSSHGYDDSNFRPWDQTYRGVSGFDSQGHGHYFANYPNSHNNQEQPSLPQNSPHQQPPPRPFNQQSGHHESSHNSQQHSSNSQQSYQDSDSPSYGGGHGNSNNDRNNSGKGTYSGNWNYIKNELLNSNDRNNNGQHSSGQHGYNSQTQEKETHQSSSYGERPGQRPLSTSYLHERETPTVISGDSNSDANSNQTKQSQTTKSYDNDHTNRNNYDDSTDKISTADALKNPIDETNTVTSSTDNTTE